MLVKLLFSLTVKLVVFLKQGFLGTDLVQRRSGCSWSDTAPFIAASGLWCESFYLLNYSLSWVDLVYDSEETRQLCLVSRQHLKLFNQVITALTSDECQLIDIRTIAFLSQLQCVLLEVEGAKQLVDGKTGQIALVYLDVFWSTSCRTVSLRTVHLLWHSLLILTLVWILKPWVLGRWDTKGSLWVGWPMSAGYRHSRAYGQNLSAISPGDAATHTWANLSPVLLNWATFTWSCA